MPRAAITREDVFKAALEVFREQGYDRTTVREIADRANVPISTLYTKITSKEELFLELVMPVITGARERMDALVASDMPPRDKLRAAIVGAAEAFDDHPQLFIYLRDFYPALEMADPGSRNVYEAQWEQLLQQGIDSGLLRSDIDPKVVSFGILGMISWMHHWYQEGGRLTAAQIGEQFAATIIAGLEAPHD